MIEMTRRTTRAGLAKSVADRSVIRVVDDGFTSTVEVFGSLTSVEQRAFERAMQKASLASDGVILDLRGCNICDSTTLVAMVNYKRALESHLQVIVSEFGVVRRTFESCGLLRKLSVVDGPDRAKTLLLRGM